MKTITASDANRNFSGVMREVANGEQFVIVSRGSPVATIAPMGRNSEERQEARAALLRRLKIQIAEGCPSGPRDWTRDDLYDE